MAPLRWGIIGAGRISHDFVTAVQIYPEKHRVIAIGSGKKESAEKFAREHQIPKSYQGYEGIAKDNEIDAVYIGNLNTQHYDSVRMMLENNKPVLCEKPFTMNEKQTRELVKLARSKKIFLMEAVWSRCFPAYKKMKEIIESGKIGDVLYVHVTHGFAMQNKDRLTQKELGGGAILDLGVYCLQFQQFIFHGMKPEKIDVKGTLTKSNVDGTTAALIFYKNGQLASIACSAEAQMPNEGIVVGTKGTIRLPYFWSPTQVILNDGEEIFNFDLPKSKVEFVHYNSAGLHYEADEVKNCLEKGYLESPQITLDETIELARMMDLMRKEVGLQFPEDSL